MKKVSKKKTASKKQAAPPVVVKIDWYGSDYRISSSGTQVAMKDKDYRFVQDAVRRFSKAQKILASYVEVE